MTPHYIVLWNITSTVKFSGGLWLSVCVANNRGKIIKMVSASCSVAPAQL